MTGTREKVRAVFLATIMIVSMVAMGATALAGSAAAQTSPDDNNDVNMTTGDDQTLVDGAANQTLTRITLQDELGGAFGNGETVFSLPDGLTVNESQSDITPFTNSSTLDITGVSVSDDGTEITVTHDGNSQEGDVLRVRDIVVDVAPDTVATNGDTLPLRVEHQSAGVSKFSGIFTVNKATLSFTAGVTGPALGSNGELLDDSDDTLTIAANGNTIANGSTVTIFANQSNGITFDESLSISDLTFTENGISVDTEASEITASAVTLVINSSVSDGDTLDVSGLQVNVTGDADAFTLTGEASAPEATGTYTLDNSGFDEISIEQPSTTVDFDNVPSDISVATDGALIDQNITVNGSADEIGANTNVTIAFNETNAGLTFADVGTVYLTNNTGVVKETLTAEVNDNSITVNVSGNYTTNDNIVFENVTVDTTADAAGAYSTVAEIQSGPDATVLEVSNDSPNNLTVTEPTADFGGDQEVFVDNVGVTAALSNLNINALADGQINATENLTISLDTDTGVSFDTSQTISLTGSGGLNGYTVTESTIELNISNTLNDGESVIVQAPQVNVTPGADDVTPSVTVYTGTQDYTFDSDDQINTTDVTPDNVAVDSGSGVTVDATETVTSTVLAENGSLSNLQFTNQQGFAGADITLNLTAQPDGANYDTSDVVNTTSLTTGAEGLADFNFSADTTGSYEITASLAGDESQNATFTYTVTPGQAALTEVSGFENGIAGGASSVSNNLKTAVYAVNFTDSAGNLIVDGNVTFELGVSGQFTDILAVAGNISDDGTPDATSGAVTDTSDGYAYNASVDDANNGTVYVFVDSANTGDITLEAVPTGNSSDVDRDSGTATFFGQIDSATIEIAEGTVFAGESVEVTATALTADGDVIEVPRIGTAFSIDNGTVASFNNTGDVETNASGVATVEVNADAAGETEISVTADTEVRQRTAAANLTVTPPTVNVPDQALSANGEVYAEVSAPANTTAIVTYTDADGDLVIAGLATLTEEVTDETVSITVENASGFPGEHTVHLVPTSDLSDQNYSVGDTVSTTTANNVVAQDNATVYNAAVDIADQSYENGTTTIEVASATFEYGDAVVAIHDANGDIIGISDIFTNSTSGLTVTVDEITETTDVTAMLHFVNNSEAGDPVMTADSPTTPVTDTANVEITTPADGGGGDDGGDDQQQPGFGVAVAALALLSAALLALRRRE